MIESNLSKFFLSTAPEEMLCEIITFLPFRELIHMFMLSKKYCQLFMNSELLFHKLCIVFCKQYEVPLDDIDDQRKKVLNLMTDTTDRNHSTSSSSSIDSDHYSPRIYFQVLQRLIRAHGYRWDTEFPYYQQSDYSKIYKCDETTLSVLEQPLHGDFITIKARKLLMPGHFYTWQYKLEKYLPDETSNSFKVMVGVESLYFFPFGSQHSGDVIGWQASSKGCALITGPKQIVRSACAAFTHTHQQNLVNLSQNFQQGDSIIVEFDFRVPSEMKDEHAEEQRLYERYQYSQQQARQLGKIRFSLLWKSTQREEKNLIHLTPWLDYGDPRFAPYVPACSVNDYQSISIGPNYQFYNSKQLLHDLE
ncbi:hypothetical protein C9374_008252 [Naegleria lovaniensis]|uniref:F-box domain-containing protein n=1 Tax=Naegleria lovaniensis TaxID=51637 RepID=A0AA88KI83_NAELO|nr:uncharacterized protein C9374_008252 [Naegleria lovaniensis]KAG2378613.1 hypothetical protein C9374_008252 [Naegleria lovaniensis]